LFKNPKKDYHEFTRHNWIDRANRQVENTTNQLERIDRKKEKININSPSPCVELPQ